MQRARLQTGWMLAAMTGVMTIPLASWLYADPGLFLERIGWTHLGRVSAYAWLSALLVTAGYVLYTCWGVPFIRPYLRELSLLKAAGVGAAVASGFLEELVFRTLLMDWAQALGASDVLQVLVSAAVFGAGHAIWGLFARDVRAMLPAVAATTVLGALLAVTYLLAGRNVLPCIAAHTAINLVIEPWLLLAAVSGHFVAKGDGTVQPAAQHVAGPFV